MSVNIDRPQLNSQFKVNQMADIRTMDLDITYPYIQKKFGNKNQ